MGPLHWLLVERYVCSEEGPEDASSIFLESVSIGPSAASAFMSELTSPVGRPSARAGASNIILVVNRAGVRTRNQDENRECECWLGRDGSLLGR
jgi:hypothetical protein